LPIATDIARKGTQCHAGPGDPVVAVTNPATAVLR
jgi:hypothetical protein